MVPSKEPRNRSLRWDTKVRDGPRAARGGVRGFQLVLGVSLIFLV